MPRLAAVALAVVLLAPSPAAAASQTPLARKLSRALAVPHVARAHTSALAVDLATGKQLYARNLRMPLIPASNEKLAVTYASLLALGPSFRFSTDVLGEGELDGTLWRGDVVLKGYGDPTLSTLDLLSLASQLRSQGIRRVTGQVIGDESFFDAKRMGPGWKSYFFINESPALSALTVDRGRYKGRATRQPALAAALSFRAALLRAGISVAGRALTGTADSAAVPLATIESVPLAGSPALHGPRERQLHGRDAPQAARRRHRPPGHDRGRRAGRASSSFRSSRSRSTGVRIVDGSGLSRLDRLTTEAVVAMLRSSWLDEDLRELLIDALPVAGRSGTLDSRMRGTVAAGRVRAKTGTLNEASALSGYVRRRYAFSVIQNGSPVSIYWARVAQDQFATVLAR